MRYAKRPALVGFKGDLLRQHDIARDEVAIRHEAPFADMVARAAEFLDVGLRAMMDPIARPGIAAGDVEIPESLVAGTLLRREPTLQQGQRSCLSFEAERSAAGTRSRHDQRKRRKQQRAEQSQGERAYRQDDLLGHRRQPPTRRG